MGCDIHAYKEIKVAGKWHFAGVAHIARRYGVFGLMTGGQVRGDDGGLELTPKGLPDDVTEPVKASSDAWDSDGHSHSYLTSSELRKLRDKFDEWEREKPGGDPKAWRAWYDEDFGEVDRHVSLLRWPREGCTTKWIEDVRLVFWFDN